ncbi:hypothetical protein [Spirosoma aerolatum]|uniref:hypothetical protein n=1 Tax=Spirosoma aerolatum TaxID=1211326 RepID=UPI0009AD8BF3|nr:hypothetical protein [Spirosoma aerolatum]
MLVDDPSWFIRREMWLNNGAKNGGRYKLIDGKWIVMTNRRIDIASEDMIGVAGMQAVMDTSIKPDKNRFEWTHSDFLLKTGFPNVESLNDPANAKAAEKAVRRVARMIPICFAEGNELMEGIMGTSDPYAPHLRWFHDERRIIYEEVGLDIRNFGTYGGWGNYNGDPWNFQYPGGASVPPNHPYFKKMVSSPEAARDGIAYFTAMRPQKVGAFIKHYPDMVAYASRYFNKAFAAERMSYGMGAERGFAHPDLVYIDWNKIEGLPPNPPFQHNNFYYERQKPNGDTVSNMGHPPVDFDWQVGNIFCIGLCRTSGYVMFDERNKFSPDPTSDNFPPQPLRSHDAGLVAGYFYNQCKRTEGKPWRYMRYRFKNSETWIEPQTDGTTILEHASAFDGAYANKPGARRGRPDAMFREKDGAIDAWGFDPSRGKRSVETIIGNPIGDVMIEMPLTGSKLALYNE